MPKSLHVKKGDTVLVISGGQKGSKGKVIQAMPMKERVLVERVNMIKRHTRPTQKNPAGGIVEKEAPIHASKVKLICPKCNEAIRARRHVLADGKVMRRCPKCSEVYK